MKIQQTGKMDYKIIIYKTKTFSLIFCQHQAMTGSEADTSCREELRDFNRTSDLHIQSDNRNKSYRGKYCSWCQVQLTSTCSPHTPCIHGYVNTETYLRLDSGRQFGGHKLTN